MAVRRPSDEHSPREKAWGDEVGRAVLSRQEREKRAC